MKKTLLSVGSYVTDLMCRVDRFPSAGETVPGSNFTYGPGGKGSNQIVAAHKLGTSVMFYTKVGDDIFGEYALDYYNGIKLDTRFVEKDSKYSTGAALITVNKITSENCISVDAGASLHISNDTINRQFAQFPRAGLFLTQLETNTEASLYALQSAKKHGIPTVLNAAPAKIISQDFYRYVDFLIVNEVEAADLSHSTIQSSEDCIELIEKFHERGVNTVIITRGSRSTLLSAGNGVQRIDVFHVDELKDTTGAGDAFVGGFCSVFMETEQIVRAVEFGHAAAALCTQKIGTAPAMPTRKEVEQFLAKRIY